MLPNPGTRKPESAVPKDRDLFETEAAREAEAERGDIFYFYKKVPEKGGIEVEKKFVSVMDVELEVNTEGEGTQFTEAEFRNFSLDKMSKDLLQRLAIAIKLDQPLLIEGETDIGKTRAIEHLAFLTNNHLIRVNLSGQTDVSEFIGRFVPSTENARQRFMKVVNNPEALRPESRAILDRAHQEERSLNEDESARIADLENIPMADAKWIWQNGAALSAAKYGKGRGCWLYLDEMGGAEPSVLLRLNPLLDKPRRMPVSERGGEIVEAGPAFRLLASTNPPEYAGNEPFRPDYLRRWVYQSMGRLDMETVDSRLAFVMRGLFPEQPEIGHEIRRLAVEFHTQAQQLLPTILKQRQVFRFEFSDLARVMAYVDEFRNGDILKTAEEAIFFYYLNKFKEEPSQPGVKSPREQLLDLWLQLKDKLKTKEKLEVIGKGRAQREAGETQARQAALKDIENLRREILGPRGIRVRVPPDIAEKIDELLK